MDTLKIKKKHLNRLTIQVSLKIKSILKIHEEYKKNKKKEAFLEDIQEKQIRFLNKYHDKL